ncbi:hypothetical protein [Desulfitobacterium hafniense]|uniref:Uncharacterized protein n=1 Tax=Desulfitobacterium hafniense (strain Y51) TaxID=138119 RepID=Q24ZC6_DESHY|nr:hypothetical protein [Desulfitobacterium hafniense]BAE82616.1 hypothetical protein DSY0827 [Desulfitobacterium hafniense Y51]
MKIFKKTLILCAAATFLTVGLTTSNINAAPMSPQGYWTVQESNQNQSGSESSQRPSYYPYYGQMNPGYWSDNGWYNYGNSRWNGQSGWNMSRSGWWCW